uniref:Uncharacterized protein n=1 Tax=Anguilla anguilla TaxID=7936 RepID=A0A0E9UCY5_ANGAN
MSSVSGISLNFFCMNSYFFCIVYSNIFRCCTLGGF